MKNDLKSTMIFTTVLLAFSCGENGSHEKSEHSHKEDTELRLDHGHKWIANSETTVNIQDMIQIMNAFEKSDDVLDYRLLKEKLDKKFKMIFDECTMQGEAHEQLHNYMLPMRKLFAGLASDDINECESSYNILNEHLSEYGEFFE